MTTQVPVFSTSQQRAARALAASGGVKRTDVAGTFLTRSSAGKFEYVTDANGCTCPASGPCKHQCAVIMELSGQGGLICART